MFFILSKILAFLTNPILWIGFAVGLSFVSRKEIWKKRWRILSLLFALIFTNEFLGEFALQQWEYPSTRVSDLQESYDVGILLSGFTYYSKDLPNSDKLVYFGSNANRGLQAVDLYKRGVFKKFLLTGGSGVLVGEKFSESELTQQFLLRFGVPAEDILVEEASRNTRENAIFSKQFLEEQRLTSKKLLLITSAFHMPRAKRCFKKVGLQTTPFSVDFKTKNTTTLSIDKFIPSNKAIYLWNILLMEWVGLVAYKMVGYI